jgi:hypothetical protein
MDLNRQVTATIFTPTKGEALAQLIFYTLLSIAATMVGADITDPCVEG